MGTALRKLDAELSAAVADIESEFLDSRNSLPHSGNNRPPLPTEPKARQVHKSMVDQDCTSVYNVMALLFNNADMRMPPAEVLRPLRRMERWVERRIVAAQQQREDVTPLIRVMTREQRANGRFDLCQFAVVERSQEPEVLKAAIDAGRQQVEATEEAVRALERQYITLAARQLAPTRHERPTLEIMR